MQIQNNPTCCHLSTYWATLSKVLSWKTEKIHRQEGCNISANTMHGVMNVSVVLVAVRQLCYGSSSVCKITSMQYHIQRLQVSSVFPTFSRWGRFTISFVNVIFFIFKTKGQYTFLLSSPVEKEKRCTKNMFSLCCRAIIFCLVCQKKNLMTPRALSRHG